MNARELYATASQHYASLNFEEAIKAITLDYEALLAEPMQHEGNKNSALGFLKLLKGDLAGAIECLTLAIDNYADDRAYCYRNRAICYINQKNMTTQKKI